MLIFEQSLPGRANGTQVAPAPAPDDLPAALLRTDLPLLPQVSELQAVRHYTRLSQKNFSIDTHFYPLGSCTMKYNPRAANELALWPVLRDRHPLAPATTGQGFLACLWELQEILAAATGMAGVSLTPLAGAQGELAGIAMIEAYHRSRGDTARREILVPDAAHGTNPATAVMCGYTVREIPTDAEGDVDLDALRAAVGPHTAGLMLTNPSTLGVFERRIGEIQRVVHEAGGLLYYDGANLNAILGHARPGDMGFDVVHLNLHKTFSTPHGGGGPGAGPVLVKKRLKAFLPGPLIMKEGDRYTFKDQGPESMGPVAGFYGNVGIMIRAAAYIRSMGADGLSLAAKLAVLNANYLRVSLSESLEIPYDSLCKHEFVLSARRLKEEYGITATDIAKGLIDRGIHPPTVYFPLIVHEALMVEPTETENRETLDHFVEVIQDLVRTAAEAPDQLKGAPRTTPVGRLDEVLAARKPKVSWT